MTGPQPTEVTRLLALAGAGEKEAADELLPLVYSELRSLAEHRLAKLPPGQTLQPTALVHEAYVRLVEGGDIGWEGRGHFFGAAARSMRDILVDRARAKARVKHGGDRKRVALDQAVVGADDDPVDFLALDAAMQELAKLDERKHEVVMLRYFAGLTVEETARALGLSSKTVKRDWSFARTWLYDAMVEQEDRP